MLDNPNDPQFLRHRGHRYVTIREFDRAIADLEKAGEMIKGKSNKVEQDGGTKRVWNSCEYSARKYLLSSLGLLIILSMIGRTQNVFMILILMLRQMTIIVYQSRIGAT